MQSMTKLQMFYKVSQQVDRPWAVARAIVDGTAKGDWWKAMWGDQIDPDADEDTKRSRMGKIVAGIEGNPYNSGGGKSVDDDDSDFISDDLSKGAGKATKKLQDPERALVDHYLGSVSKGTVNGKKFSYDDEGHQEAIDYATELMENKEPVDFEWHEKKSIQKLSPAVGALAGWWLGGTMQDIARGHGQPTPAQQREFERQIQQAMRQKGRKMTKESAMEKMQSFFQKDDNDTYVRKTPVSNAVQAEEEVLQKIVSFPPFAGARFDPTSHRWVQPKNYGQTYAARGGKKRIRGTGTGVHERSVSGHGKGRIREEGAGAKGKTETHLAASRRKEGFTHGKQEGRKKD